MVSLRANDQHHEGERLEQRVHDRLDGTADEDGRVVDDGILDPSGKLYFSAAIDLRTWFEISMAFEPGDWKIGMAMAASLSRSERSPYSAASISVRSTSLSRVTTPDASRFTIISSNCSAPRRRPCTLMGICSSTPVP
jgi:hypothetical protein